MDDYLYTFPFKETVAINLKPGKLKSFVKQRHLQELIIEHRAAESPMLHMIENLPERTGFSFSAPRVETAIVNGYQLNPFSPFIIRAGENVEILKRSTLNTIGVSISNDVLTKYLGNAEDELYSARGKYHVSKEVLDPASFTKIRAILFCLLEEELSAQVEKDYIENLCFKLAECITSSHQVERECKKICVSGILSMYLKGIKNASIRPAYRPVIS